MSLLLFSTPLGSTDTPKELVIPLPAYDSNPLTPNYVLYNCPNKHSLSYVCICNVFLRNVVSLNENIPSSSNLTCRLTLNKHNPEYFDVDFDINKMLMKGRLSKFLQGHKFFICVYIDVSCSFPTPENDDKTNTRIAELFAIIYSRWYKKTTLIFWTENRNPNDDKYIYRSIREEIKTVFNWLFLTCPALMKYLTNIERRISCEKRSAMLLATLYPEILKKYIWYERCSPINPHQISSEDRDIIMHHEKFGQLWKEYVELYYLAFEKPCPYSTVPLWSYFSDSVAKFRILLTKFKQVKMELLQLPCNPSSDIIIRYINIYIYIEWFEKFPDIFKFNCDYSSAYRAKYFGIKVEFSKIVL